MVNNINTETDDRVVGQLDIAIEVVLKVPLTPLPTEKMEHKLNFELNEGRNVKQVGTDAVVVGGSIGVQV
jgi:hypothetical protein